LKTFAEEPFLFFADGKGNPVTGKAGDYFDMTPFEYEYEPGFGEDIVTPSPATDTKSTSSLSRAVVKGNVGSASVPTTALKSHLSAIRAPEIFAEITLPVPHVGSAAREFDVIVNAPAGLTRVSADSPYYAGTIAFFGNMRHMVDDEATFSVPLPRSPATFADVGSVTSTVNIRIVPSSGSSGSPQLRSILIRMR
jgi:tyrosinase